MGAGELYRALRDYRGNQAYEELIAPRLGDGLDAYRAQLEPLSTYGQIASRPERSVYWLAIPYAFSRISDVLLLGFQPDLDPLIGTPWAHRLHLAENAWPAVSVGKYLELFTALGMTEVTGTGFEVDNHTPSLIMY